MQSSQWVDDDIVTASQNLLHQQHPGVGSLQSPILASQLAVEPQGGREFVQIVNIGNNHWITLSTVGYQPGYINVYDSLHIRLSSNVKELIAYLLQWKEDCITIHHCDVQWQVGVNDCGIFAIAFVTAICNRDEPHSIVFYQNNMRKHLTTCFENGKLTPFSDRSRKRRVKAAKEDTLPVHCTRRLPDRGDLMIQCATCKKGYHTTCINIPESFLQNDYFCGC